ncbi:MAG: Bug family tripartite tricarboxylate transporter substrate binding protein [Burkholderiales bacterium]
MCQIVLCNSSSFKIFIRILDWPSVLLPVIVAAMVATGLASAKVKAQEYPVKQIRLIVPFAPGGSADILARILAQRSTLGQPIVIENVPGANGAIGLARAAKSTADGYTLATGATSTFAVGPHTSSNLGYDPMKDFVPIAVLGMFTSVLTVNGNLPVKSVGDLVSYAKANPGKLNYASLGTGSSHHLGGEQFRRTTGIDVVHVPYKGSPQALNALLVGEVQFFFFPAFVDSISNLQNGRLRALAVADSKRSVVAPDVPTLLELGYPIERPTWHILVGPAGLPNAVVQRLAAEVQRVSSLEDVKQMLAKQGVESRSMTPEELKKYVADQYVSYGRLVREIGLKVE